MKEVELKFAVTDEAVLRAGLKTLSATREGPAQLQVDTYYRHPCRDFKETGEALRIRRVDGEPLVTYKGPREALGEAQGDSGEHWQAVKSRRELEWSLGPGDPQGELMRELLERLGFCAAAELRKTRETYLVMFEGEEVTVAIDAVESLGLFAELELLVEEGEQSQRAAGVLSRFASRLGLERAERMSYLRMLLVSQGRDD